MIFLLKGIILGFAIAAPVGPIGVLCIRKTLAEGRWAGLFCGLGAAVADTFYGAIAGFGLSFISQFLLGMRTWLQLGGGIFLLCLGFLIFREKPAENSAAIPTHTTLLRDFTSTLFLTLSNPMTILSFIGIFAGLGIATAAKTYHHSVLLVAGVFIGSSLWWLLLAEVVTLFRKKVTHPVLVWINRIAGIVILCFGLIAILFSFS